jgi:hypothetical protein
VLDEPFTSTFTSTLPHVSSGRTPVVALKSPLCWTYSLLPEAFWR